MSNAAAPGSIAELMNLVPDAYRPELVSDAQICAHLIELEAEHYRDDPAVFGWARQLVERLADTHQRTAWAARVRSAGASAHQRELQAEQEGRAYLDALLSTPKRARPAKPAPAPASNRPGAAGPIWHQIPAELQARNQWVLWRLEADKNGKPTKVPYNARTARPASTTAPRTWSSFADAKAAYLTQPNYFAGVGYVFSKDDPYSGADFDHCLDAGQPSSWAAAHLAALRAAGAYVEISVSGSGVHAITRATVGKGRKTPRGEVYDRGRFFTVSGRALEPTPIGDGQAAIDALRADLGGSKNADKTARDAGQPTEHSAEEWEQARQLTRTDRERLLKQFLASTAKEGTQGYFVARGLYAEFHQRWAFVGLYRADGALDDSQVRAVMACSIRPRDFKFPEFVVIMSHYFARHCAAKWGTKDAYRAELERLWNLAPAPKYERKSAPQHKPAVAIHKPRGRASNHAATVERVYGALLAERIGDGAIVHTADIAAACGGLNRVTVAGILAELRTAGRISTERNGRYGGLIVRFSDVAIVAEQPAEYSATAAETAIAGPAPLEETSSLCVSSELREPGYSSETPALAELAAAYLDDPEAGAPALRSRATGECVRRHTAGHFAELVLEHYGTHYTAGEARAAYRAERDRRAAIEKAEWDRFFVWLRLLPTPDLIAYILGGCRREIAELARQHETTLDSFDTHKYRVRLRCAKQQLGWRGVALPEKPTKTKPVTPGKPRRPRPVACEPVRYEQPAQPAAPDYATVAMGLAERLRQRLQVSI